MTTIDISAIRQTVAWMERVEKKEVDQEYLRKVERNALYSYCSDITALLNEIERLDKENADLYEQLRWKK